MRFIPTWNEIKEFLKFNKKVTTFSIVGFMALFLLLLGYNLLSSDEEILEPTYLSQGEISEILEQEQEDVDQSQIENINEALSQERFVFTVLVENEVQDFMSNQSVLKSILIRDDVIEAIEEKAGVEIEPTAMLAVNVDNENNMLKIGIGTGDIVDNEIIADAYYNAITNNEIPYLNDHSVYQMNTEPILEEELSSVDSVALQVADLSIPVIILMIIGALIFSVILGLIIAIIRSIFQKNVPVSYKLEQSSKDKVVYLTKLSSITKEQYTDNLAFAIANPLTDRKLVLTQEKLSDELSKKLNTKVEANVQPKITVAQEIAHADPAYTYDEIVILVKQNQTEKSWYKNQRIQVEKLYSKVTIIQY